MDLDDFKRFNDNYGHPVGDEVLQQTAALLEENAQEADLVGRYGGDEFTVILPETDMEGAIALAQRLRAAVQEYPYRTSAGLAVPLRMSFGIATYPADASQPHELIGRADANLYESKQQGGDAITTSEASVHAGDIRVGLFGVLDGLITAVDHKDDYTRKHSVHVADYAIAIAQGLGLSEESQRTLRIASLLHDVGKIGIPDCVLRKPGRLDEEELAIIRQHATLGELIIKEVPSLSEVVAANQTELRVRVGECLPLPAPRLLTPPPASRRAAAPPARRGRPRRGGRSGRRRRRWARRAPRRGG